MSQIALPLAPRGAGMASRIVVGNANRAVVEAMAKAAAWPFRTAVLPDLASRLGAALHLEIGAPDDAMVADLIALHAELRGLALGPDALAYLAPRAERSHLGIERLVAAIDRLSLERKAAPTLSIWRDALEELMGPEEPRLL